MELTSRQIKRLRAEGHRSQLKPVVMIGNKGLTDNLHSEVDSALDHHELIKLRIPGSTKSEKRELGNLICQKHRAALIESIGNIIVIYRPNPETGRFAEIINE